MTLRTRLLAAAATVLLLLVVGMTAIVVRQRAVLTDQIDEQLETVASAIGQARRSGLGVGEPPRPDEAAPPTGDFYFAALLPDGTVMTIVRPVSHPEFAPEPDGLVDRAQTVEPGGPPIEPFTVESVEGPGRARTIVVAIDDEISVVVARSTNRIDEALRQLAIAGALAVLAVAVILGLVLWWVDRLGLQPINRLTRAAEEVAAGRSDRRVEHSATGTETGRLGASFNTMLDARQTAENRQRRFVADASHELRTPLTTLRGYTALHASGGLTTPGAVDDAMGRIQVEADRMAALVEDLLTLASLDEDRPLDLAPVDLSRLLVDIGNDAAAIQPDRRVDTTGVEPGIAIRADRDLLTQAVTAATTNALRHTPVDAALTIRAGLGPDGGGDVGGDGVGDVVRIEVRDEGPGIEPDHLPHLFDRFYRVDAGRAAPGGGRGLGLSIARTVIEAHGGTIGATSGSGVGTTITIELPLAGPG